MAKVSDKFGKAIDKATQQEIQEGINDDSWVSPLGLVTLIDSHTSEVGKTGEWSAILNKPTTLSSFTDDVGYALSSNLATVATSGLATDVTYNATTVSIALDNKFDSTVGKADTSTAETGTDDTQWMSPLKSLQQVQQFGLGGTNSISNTTNANNLTLGSFVQVEGVSTDLEALNYPPLGIDPTLPVSFNILTFGVTTRATQIAVENFGQGGKPDGRMFLRVLHDIWGPWQEIYTSAVLNVNEFSGDLYQPLALGKAINSTDAIFYLPLNSFVPPSSVTLTSTFTITDDGRATIAAGISTAATLSSSGRMIKLQVGGLSNITPNQPLLLSGETSTSKITVNF